MDNLLGIIAVVGVSLSLSYAAIQDYKTREVPNGIWIGGLVIFPVTLLRIIPTGLLLFYGVQSLVSLVIVLLGFRGGILGGADGKAILLIALTYPWIVIETIWLMLAPIGVLIGGFLVVGAHSLILLVMNAINWRRWTFRRKDTKPAKSIYWLSRRLIQPQSEEPTPAWIPVSVPLVVYILIAYAAILAWTVMSVLI